MRENSGRNAEMAGKDATNTERRGERPRLEFNVNNATMSEGTNPIII